MPSLTRIRRPRVRGAVVFAACVLIVLTLGPAVVSRFMSNVGLLALTRTLVQYGVFGEARREDANLIEAERWLNAATGLDAGNWRAWRGFGFALQAQGRADEAVSAWQTAGGMGEEFARRGEPAYHSQSDAEALMWYERSLRVEPNCPAQYGLGELYRKQGNLKEALQWFRACVELDPLYIQAHLSQCNTLIGLGEYHQALSLYRMAEVSVQRDAFMLACAGVSHWELGEYGEAANVLERAIRQRPLEASFHQWLSLTYARQGRYSEAVTESLVAIDLNSERPDYWRHLGNIYLAMNQSDAAANAFGRALELDPNDQEAHKSLDLLRKRIQQP